MRDAIKALGIGERLPLTGHGGATGFVKRTHPRDYVLFDNANKERSRWGTLEQIATDVEFFVANGTLPEPDMPRW